MKRLCTTALRGLALLTLLGLPPAGLAQSQDRHPQTRLSYTWAEARLVDEDPQGGDDYTGVRIAGAAQFHPNLFFTGALTSVSSDGVDLDTIDLGLGFRQALNSDTDVVAGVGLVWADIDAGRFGGDDDTGLSLSGGLRSFLAPRFEVGAYATYVELFGDGDVSIVGEGLLHMTPQLALVGSLSLSDDVNVLTAGVRWNFTRTP
jgi:hypothetical protein